LDVNGLKPALKPLSNADAGNTTRAREHQVISGKAYLAVMATLSPKVKDGLGNIDNIIDLMAALHKKYGAISLKEKGRMIARLFGLKLSDFTSMNAYIEGIIKASAELEAVDSAAGHYKVIALLQGLDHEKFDAYSAGISGLHDVDFDTVVKDLTHLASSSEKVFRTSMKSPIVKKPSRPCRHCGAMHWDNQCTNMSRNKNTVEPYVGNLCLRCNSASGHPNWCIDSGSSQTITNDRSDFSAKLTSSNGRIEVASGQTIPIVAKGPVKILPELIIDDVKYVPDLKHKLLSTKSLLKANMAVLMVDTKCMIIKNFPKSILNDMDTLVSIEQSKDGLFYIPSDEIALLTRETEDLKTSKSSIEEWHNRLAHINSSQISNIIENKQVLGAEISDNTPFQCQTCVVGKQSRTIHLQDSNRIPDYPGELLVADVLHIPERGENGENYVSVIVDALSSYTFVKCLKSKNSADIAEHMEETILFIRTQIERNVKRVRTDNGLEYTSSLYQNILKKAGVIHELTAPYTPADNGIAERKNRTLVEAVRTILADGKYPKSMWPLIVQYVCYTQNRTLIRNDKTPFEHVFRYKPEISLLQPFGIKCWVHIETHQTKLEGKAVEAILIGYPEHSSAYIVRTCNGNVVTSRNVTFQKPLSISTYITTLKQSDSTITPTDHSAMDNSDAMPNTTALDMDDTYEFSLPTSTNHDIQSRRSTRSTRFQGSFIESSDNEDEIRDEPYFTFAVNDSDNPDINDALHGQDKDLWRKAINEEVENLTSKGTWEVVPSPPNCKPIHSKLVLVVKRDENGQISRYKARLVAKGFTQTKGIDYDETFAPVVRLQTIMCILSIAASKGYLVHQMDIDGAYLNATLSEDIHMIPPKELGLTIKSNQVLKLKKSIYGLKQAGREWNQLFNQSLVRNGWKQSKSDNCLFTKMYGPNTAYITVYVDDLIIAAPDGDSLMDCKTTIKSLFSCKDIGELKHILGIRIQRDKQKKRFYLDQQTKIEELLKKNDTIICSVPLDPKTAILPYTQGEANKDRCREYKSLIGSILHISNRTRPDIAASIGILARYAANPGPQHFESIRTIIGYLKKTKSYKLIIDGNSELKVTAYSDSDWAGDRSDRKSTSGYLIKLGNSLISWHSKKQSSVSLSTMEAEYIAASECCKEVIWTKALLREMKIMTGKIPIHSDNMSAIDISKNPADHSRSKHIDLRYHHIRDLVKKSTIELIHISGEENPADILTKALPISTLSKHSKTIGIDGVPE
jgi:hypothetical protein